MNGRMRKKPIRNSSATRACLLDAAESEFNAHGFEGTDSNRIARRAGYAPQTFYRHFPDKTAIFLAVYERWWTGEVAALEKSARKSGAPPGGTASARIALAFHTQWRGFRRSLRHLAIVDPAVRAARTAARRAQIARIRQTGRGAGRGEAGLVAALLAAERLCDAAAEGELADLGLSKKAALKMVADAMAALAGGAGKN
jgi:AcrR family transcriptional regulator